MSKLTTEEFNYLLKVLSVMSEYATLKEISLNISIGKKLGLRK